MDSTSTRVAARPAAAKEPPPARAALPSAPAARALNLPARILGRLSRVTSSGRFIPEIDGLRFIAIGAVVLFHLSGYLLARSLVHFSAPPAGDWLAKVASQGHFGVELFFVISGFILALPFASHHLKAGPPVRLRSYYLRRVTRLEPPYILTTVILFALLVIVKRESAFQLLPHLAASIVYLHNLIFGQPSLVIGVAWSLEIEIQFYLLVPLLASIFAVRGTIPRRALIGATALAAMCLQWLVLGNSARASLSILSFIQFFLMGFLLCDLYLVTWNEAPQRRWVWDLFSLAGWPLLVFVLRSESLQHWLFPPLALLLYCAAFCGRLTNAVMRFPIITAIGGMCYTIYLIHYDVISAVARYTKALSFGSAYWVNLAAQLVLVGVPVVIVSAVYFLLLEQPCMRRDWPQRLREWMKNLVTPQKEALEADIERAQ